jgi:hypothetical protein
MYETKAAYGQIAARKPGVNVITTIVMGMYAAKILADSIANGVRLVTFEVTFPRFILAEFNTHRVLSRNSASSRAIPVERRISQVWHNPFVPEAFGLNKSGMQASANLGGWKATLARWLWIFASRVCCVIAWLMCKLDVHKQHANRILETWAWHTVVVTATEWENFFRLRTHKAAQPEMQITAKLMRQAFEASTPRTLDVDDWHLPYIACGDDGFPLEEELALARALVTLDGGDEFNAYDIDAKLVAISVVRCAAVSFERQYTSRTAEQYAKRHDDMRTLAHWSPFEHQACVLDGANTEEFIGNFRMPWRQYRKTFAGESVWKGEE